MKILGVSAFFHDSAAALVEDGRLVRAAQEERFTRIKHDASLPVEAAAYCLQGETPDYVVFYEKPLEKFERLLVSSLREFPRGLKRFNRSMASWLSKRLWMKSEIAAAFRVPTDRVLFSRHHLSHAAAAFYGSPFEEAAIITVDGVGEWATTSIFRGAGTEIELLGELHFPDSIGLVYSALTAYLGFRVNEGEYKVMGLAAYGEPTHLEALESICRIQDDGSLMIDRRFFAFQHDADKSYTPRLEKLLEGARREDVAASIQALTEKYLLRLAEHARELAGTSNLCVGGGVGLNGCANVKMQQGGPVFVHPAAGDAGGAVGAALWVAHTMFDAERAPAPSPFLGRAHAPDEIARFLDDCAVAHTRYDELDALTEEVSERLVQGEVGGWFRGGFEWGPRALGARSILADPRRQDAKDRVNRKVKFREPFRPFAPAVLASELERWFEVAEDDLLTPYMCGVVPATEEAKSTLPAVVHVDGTGRAQRVERETNPDFHALLSRFKEKTGVGVLLNTSMNLKDEPIVASPAEAYAMFIRSDLDFLILEDCLVTKKEAA